MNSVEKYFEDPRSRHGAWLTLSMNKFFITQHSQQQPQQLNPKFKLLALAVASEPHCLGLRPPPAGLPIRLFSTASRNSETPFSDQWQRNLGRG